MSRKREGLIDLIHWSRRPSTCDQTGTRKEREERPPTGLNDGPSPGVTNGLGRPHTSLGLPGRGPASSSVQSPTAQGPLSNRNGLPPLSRAGSAVGSLSANGPNPAEPPPEMLSNFQEALYVNGQPHNATSRLLRLGAGSPNPSSSLRRSALISPGSGTMPPVASAPATFPRVPLPSSASSPLLPRSLGSPEELTSSGLLPSAGSLGDTFGSRPRKQQSSLTGYSPSAAWVGSGTGSTATVGSPPRFQRRSLREDSTAMLDYARHQAQRAAETLYGIDNDIRPEDRENGAQALRELEVVLGPREVSLIKLAEEARSLRAELGRELHASDKQTSFARAQLKALERQHDRLRQQLRPRPEPLTLPPTSPPLGHHHHANGTPSPDGSGGGPTTPTLLSAGALAATVLPHRDGSPLVRNFSGSLSAPQSPLAVARAHTLGPIPLRSDSPLLPRPPGQSAAQRITASSSSGVVAFVTHAHSPKAGAAGGGGADGCSLSGRASPRSTLGSPSSPEGATAAGGPQEPGEVGPGNEAGGKASKALSGVSPTERWSLAEAMERTVQMRAINRAEAALQAVAAAHVVEVRPASGGTGESAPPVDVEELRRLKNTPGVSDVEQPSYLGVNVRRAPSPLPGSEAVAGMMLMAGGGGGGGGAGGGGGGPGLGVGFGAGAGGAPDLRSTLQWSNRGISTSKMPLLREVLGQTPQLMRLCLGGNKLSNEDVMELMVILSEPGAPRVHDIFLDQNTNLTWRCALPLALALGMSPDMAAAAAAADWAAAAAAMPPASTPATIIAPAAVPSAHDKIRRLDLRILNLCGVKLGDKGVAQLAEGLRVNNTLRELDLRRCGISDPGGAVLMDVLESNGMLRRLDASWNALRSETARALEGALAGNAGLRELGLAHNGFGDVDGARIVKGLLSHGKWLRVDLSHNNMGPGSCMMVGELLRRLGAVACSLLPLGAYGEGWAQQQLGQGARGSGLEEPSGGSSGGGVVLPSVSPPPRTVSPDPLRRCNGPADGSSPPASPTSVRIAAGQLGAQLTDGQPSLALDGNPLGSTGLRIVLDSMDATSQDMLAAGGLVLSDPANMLHPPEHVPPLPLDITVANCNVAAPSERSSSSDGADEANPFLPSIAVLCRGPDGKPRGGGSKPGGGGNKDGGGSKKQGGKSSGGGKGSKSGASKGGSSKSSKSGSSLSSLPQNALTLHSPHLDLHSPAGVYVLDLSHPATSVLVGYLLRMRERLAAAVAAGRVAAGVGISLTSITVNGRPLKVDQLASLDTWSEGTLQLTVKAPAVLAVEPPAPLTPPVALWLASLLSEPTASPLWKLSVVQAAGTVCIFTPWQCEVLLAGFDRDTQSTECVTAAQMLYARSAQPLMFWHHVLPRMTPLQQQSLRERIGDLVALDMNRPMGRYTLNLSRQVDRFVALRLQLASALESSWVDNKYFINWLNASFNGQPLDRPGLTRIRDFTLPGAGVLRLDYVSYKKPGLGQPPASPEELEALLGHLRGCTGTQINMLLQVRGMALPPPPTPPPAEVKKDRLRSPIGRRKANPPPPPPPPKPRLSALQLTHMTLWEVAQVLASPDLPTTSSVSPSPSPSPTPPPPRPISAVSPPTSASVSFSSPHPTANPTASATITTTPPPPARWTSVCGFNPEALFRRAEIYPPEWSLDAYGPPPPPPPPPDGVLASSDALLPPRVSAAAVARSVKSLGGRSSVTAATAAGGGGNANIPFSNKTRRSTREEEKEDLHDWAHVQADFHAALLLLVHQPQDLPLLVSKMSPPHAAAAVNVLLREPCGLAAVTALLTALPPLAASKFLYDQADPSPCLLAPEVRRQLLAALPQERVRLVETCARGASEGAAARARAVRTALNVWAAQRYVTAEHVAAVMGVLHTEADRVMAMVVLWPRLVDGGWKRTYLKLKLSEQRQVMMRLGYLHVYLCLADPHGISFSLDLGEPEQREIARELVRMAVKETTRAKHEARARGGFYAQTLLDFRGNGNPVSIPEDEKLWGMADSNFKTMDFLYSPTFEQSLQRVEASVVAIQRSWRTYVAKRAERQALRAQVALQPARASPSAPAAGVVATMMRQ